MTLADWLARSLEDPDPITTIQVAADWCEEQGLLPEAEWLKGENVIAPPFQAGEEWLLCTVTLYYVGRVTKIGAGWVELEEASWVHWTGRLSALTRNHSFAR